MNPKIWEEIFKNEGGLYFRDGLHTKYGIAFEHNVNYLSPFGITEPEQIKDLKPEEAKEIYKVKYLPKSKADKLPDNLAYTHLDFFINKWTQANKTLQEVCNDVLSTNLVIDGILGPKSMSAIAIMTGGYQDEIIADLYNFKRVQFYHELCQRKRKTFGYDKNFVLDLYASWLRRCRRLV